MKTRDKIILASLDLFNERGERNVTTNHIAAHLNISPGNLYYHFRSKTDIIYEIFLQYELLVDRYLQLPEGRSLTIEDNVFYLESVFSGLWRYRFFHRDLEHYLDNDSRLRKDYRAFTMRCLRTIRDILNNLQVAEILVPMEEEHQKSMALNVWLVVTSWMSFLKTSHGDANELITREMLAQGVFQVMTLEVPYLTPKYRDQVFDVQQRYLPQSLGDMCAL
jgi:AcrR family transcriptional regulator